MPLSCGDNMDGIHQTAENTVCDERSGVAVPGKDRSLCRQNALLVYPAKEDQNDARMMNGG